MNTKEIELILDGKSSKSAAGQIWSVTKFLTSVIWFGTKFTVKNAPAALGMAWEIKKEISNEIANEIQNAKKAHKEQKLEEELQMLKAQKEIGKIFFNSLPSNNPTSAKV
jgi:hypothetical protein